MNVTSRCFRLVCMFFTIALTGWCLYKYILDEDVSLVAFAKFNDDKQSLYPALTMCFWNPFYNKKLKEFGSGINTSTYSNFIQGNYWDNRMLSIDYDDVTVSLEDYMIEVGVQYGNFTTRIWTDAFIQGRKHTDMPSFYVSNRNGGSKCFTFNMPYVEKVPVVAFFMRMTADIFPNGKRSVIPNFDGSDINKGGFSVFFHLPGEHFRSYFDKKYSWAPRENTSNNYDMMFSVKNTEVLKRRNKFASPCNPDWENDDDIIMGKIMASIGCQPPHWKLNSNLPPCSKIKQMKKFNWPSYQDLQIFPPPCNVIEKIQYDYKEVDASMNEDNSQKVTPWFGITVFFPEPSFKEIKQVQAYDIESFVGNVGGYIGLFLGYSLLCIPSWISKVLRKDKKTRIERLNDNETQRNEYDESPATSIEMPSVCEDCNKEHKDLINVMWITNARQNKTESKLQDLDSKLDFLCSRLYQF